MGLSYLYTKYPGTEFYDEYPTFYEVMKWFGIIFTGIYYLNDN